MNEAFISSYIQKRSQDLGWSSYAQYVRQFTIDQNASIEVYGHSDFYVLLGQPEEVSIESDCGAYDLGDSGISEQQHEHCGTIMISNLGSCTRSVTLIQVTQTH